MTRVPVQGVIAVVIVTLAIALHGHAMAWTADSNGFRVAWTANDITAQRPDGSVAFSAAEFARSGFNEAKDGMAQGVTWSLTMRRHFRVVSLVGPLLGLRDRLELQVSPSAHPEGEERFWTFDLRRHAPLNGNTGTLPASERDIVDLRDLFPVDDLFRGLKGDAFVRRAINAPAVTSLTAVLSLLQDRSGSAPNVCASVGPDVLTRFVLTGINAQRVSVRINVSSPDVCAGHRTDLAINLPYRGPITQTVRFGKDALRVPPAEVPDFVLSLHSSSNGGGK